MPGEPGPGYWPTDPTEVGWLPPSQFVWENRMAAMPGVVWTRPFTAEGSQNIAVLNDDTLIVLEEGQLIGLDVADGHLRWRQAMTETVANAIMNDGQSLLYTADRLGQVTAYPLLETEDGTTSLSDKPLWQVDLEMFRSPVLLPLPDGGVIISVWQDMAAISAEGVVLWEEEVGKRPFDWLLAGDQLIMTTTGMQGPIYSLTASGLQAWPVVMNGRLVTVGEQIWLYSHDGLYRLDPAAMTAELLYQLPQNFLGLGSIIALPDGGAMIAHRERDDSRLIAFNPDGTVQWQRSYAQLGSSASHIYCCTMVSPIFSCNRAVMWMMQLKLYAIDRQNSVLTHIFTGGTRLPLPGTDWVVSINDDLLLINVGGGSMAALDLDTAVSLISSSAN